MYLIERRLAYYQHQLSSLFQDHVGRAMNQVVAEAVSDGCESAHAARRDDHAQRDKRTARDRGALRADAVTLCCQALYVLEGVLGFMCEGACRPLAHNQMRLDAR